MEKILLIIEKFIMNMNYLENEHVLGVFFYGSFLTGYNHKNSDIDLHIIFDNSDPKHLVRGSQYVNGFRIEYFEKPIGDLYLSIENDYQNQNNALLSIIGTSKIILDKTGELKTLQECTLDKFQDPLPSLDAEEAKEYVSILTNRMEKLRQLEEKDDPYFFQLYHLTIEKIRKFYHRLKGLPKIQTSKVFQIYTDEEYRKSFAKVEIPDEEFISIYLDAITDVSLDKKEKLNKVTQLFEYAKKSVLLDEKEYRIFIKTRNK